MNSYSAFDTFLGSRQTRTVPSIRATLVRRGYVQQNAIHIDYQATTVVTAHQDGTFTLYTGGWHTATTKARINDFSPARVYQKAHVWYLTWRDDSGVWPFDAAHTVKFYDGIRVDAHGVPVALQLPGGERESALGDF